MTKALLGTKLVEDFEVFLPEETPFAWYGTMHICSTAEARRYPLTSRSTDRELFV